MISKRARSVKMVAMALVFAVSVAFLAASIFIVINWNTASYLRPHSYWGLLLMAMVAGAPIPIFIPMAIINLVLGSVLNPLAVGLVAGVGNLFGNVLTFYAGRGGFHAFNVFELPTSGDNPDPGKLDQLIGRIKNSKMVSFGRRRGLPALLVLALLPTPLFMPTIFSLGAARSAHSHFWRVMAVSFVGQTVQAIIWATFGHFGLRSILDILNILSPA